MGALIESTEDTPLRIGKIQETLGFGASALKVRTELIQESVYRLIEQQKVARTELNKRHAYYLTDKGREDVSNITYSVDSLFQTVLSNLLKNTNHHFSYADGAAVCRKFIFECFSRFGSVIARSVAGSLSNESLLNLMDTESAFTSAIKGRNLSSEAISSLKARCRTFLKSSDPDSEKLKFHLTQGYYFTQLLGFENSQVNPLVDETFADSVFYLDTNVLLVGVLYLDEQVALFDELANVSRRIGIELRVTRATINETRRVAMSRLELLTKVIDKVPEEVIHHTKDQFILAFLHARINDPMLTIEKFLEPFERLSTLCETKWQIQIDERLEDDVIHRNGVAAISSTMGETALKMRGYEKSEVVLNHDVCHYLIVQDERLKNPKTWFLTRDRSLTEASAILAKGTQPFSFYLIGFLHSISPFLTTPNEELLFVDVFSTLLSEQIVPDGPMFEVSELALMAEFHEDVMSTPPEQILIAFDYIKKKALDGRTYKQSDIQTVSLELKKFLTSSRDEQKQALEQENNRLAAKLELEKRKYEETSQLVQSQQSENESLRVQLDELQQSDAKKQKQIKEISQEITNYQQQIKKSIYDQKVQSLRNQAIALGLLGGGVLFYKERLFQILIEQLPNLAEFKDIFLPIIGLTGAVSILFPAFRYIRLKLWETEYKLIIFGVLVIAVLFFSKVLSDDGISRLANLTEVGLLIAAAMFAGRGLSKQSKE